MSFFNFLRGKGTCHINNDGSVSHYDQNGCLTRITHNKTPSGRPTEDQNGYGPNAGKTYFGPKGGCGGCHQGNKKK